MKKLMLTAVIALGTFVAVQAQEKEVIVETQAEVQNPTQQEDAKMMAKAEVSKESFKEIKASELPTAVLKAVAADFEGATVEKAYVNDKKEFKLVLQTISSDKKLATKTVFASKDGTWIKAPKTKLKQ
ncbi:hypothetical protein G5B37_10520 [Rasiella rasia]|uniref:DUF4878 domain-containing protein n=1 Tax=Rasiella rasia TaxID=2744027 RepID=A0A6G6GNB0_9FLAO|nr:hypothetical protein [Rasiella rasia]QIE59980.1 hypothetical protein G5B37_10520 [Rasiella rasia]